MQVSYINMKNSSENSLYKQKGSRPTFGIEQMQRLSNIVEDVINAKADGPRRQRL